MESKHVSINDIPVTAASPQKKPVQTSPRPHGGRRVSFQGLPDEPGKPALKPTGEKNKIVFNLGQSFGKKLSELSKARQQFSESHEEDNATDEPEDNEAPGSPAEGAPSKASSIRSTLSAGATVPHAAPHHPSLHPTTPPNTTTTTMADEAGGSGTVTPTGARARSPPMRNTLAGIAMAATVAQQLRHQTAARRKSVGPLGLRIQALFTAIKLMEKNLSYEHRTNKFHPVYKRQRDAFNTLSTMVGQLEYAYPKLHQAGKLMGDFVGNSDADEELRQQFEDMIDTFQDILEDVEGLQRKEFQFGLNAFHLPRVHETMMLQASEKDQALLEEKRRLGMFNLQLASFINAVSRNQNMVSSFNAEQCESVDFSPCHSAVLHSEGGGHTSGTHSSAASTHNGENGEKPPAFTQTASFREKRVSLCVEEAATTRRAKLESRLAAIESQLAKQATEIRRASVDGMESPRTGVSPRVGTGTSPMVSRSTSITSIDKGRLSVDIQAQQTGTPSPRPGVFRTDYKFGSSCSDEAHGAAEVSHQRAASPPRSGSPRMANMSVGRSGSPKFSDSVDAKVAKLEVQLGVIDQKVSVLEEKLAAGPPPAPLNFSPKRGNITRDEVVRLVETRMQDLALAFDRQKREDLNKVVETLRAEQDERCQRLQKELEMKYETQIKQLEIKILNLKHQLRQHGGFGITSPELRNRSPTLTSISASSASSSNAVLASPESSLVDNRTISRSFSPSAGPSDAAATEPNIQDTVSEDEEESEGEGGTVVRRASSGLGPLEKLNTTRRKLQWDMDHFTQAVNRAEQQVNKYLEVAAQDTNPTVSLFRSGLQRSLLLQGSVVERFGKMVANLRSELEELVALMTEGTIVETTRVVKSVEHVGAQMGRVRADVEKVGEFVTKATKQGGGSGVDEQCLTFIHHCNAGFERLLWGSNDSL